MGKLCRVDASASSQELNKNPRYGVKHPQMVPMTSVSQDKAVGSLKGPTGKIGECPN
jgi:hypothetical protein